MKILRIAQVNVVRMLRDRTGLFFVFALPVVIIVVFGLAFGGSGNVVLGIADGDGSSLSRDLVASVDQGTGPLEVKFYTSAADLRDAVQRNTVDMGLAIPAGYGDALRSGAQAHLEYVTRTAETVTSAVRPVLDQAIHRQAALIGAARFAASQRGISFEAALADATSLQPRIGAIEVASETGGRQLVTAGLNGYVMGAQSQLVLFMFLTSMTGATQLILSRQLGVSRRMLSTPTSGRTILLGELLGRFGVAMIQGLFIFIGTAVVFHVDWGDPLAASAVIVAFGLVSTGVAMLVGSIARTPEQASSAGVGIAMLLGAFGGAMVPPEVFPDVMKTISHVTPQAWAIDALRDVAIRDADVIAILPKLAVLLGFAAVLLAIATIRFRRAIVS